MLNVQLFVIPPWFTCAWVLSYGLVTLWRGGWRERIIASSQAAQFFLMPMFCSFEPCSYGDRLSHELASDTAMLAICLACGWRTERYPLLWACSFALLSVATDLMAVFIPGVTGWAYNSANIVWAYLLGICVLWSAISGPPGRWPVK